MVGSVALRILADDVRRLCSGVLEGISLHPSAATSHDYSRTPLGGGGPSESGVRGRASFRRFASIAQQNRNGYRAVAEENQNCGDASQFVEEWPIDLIFPAN